MRRRVLMAGAAAALPLLVAGVLAVPAQSSGAHRPAGTAARTAPHPMIRQAAKAPFPDPKQIDPQPDPKHVYFYSTKQNTKVLDCPRLPRVEHCHQVGDPVVVDKPTFPGHPHLRVCSFGDKAVYRFKSPGAKHAAWYMTPTARMSRELPRPKDKCPDAWDVVMLFRPTQGGAGSTPPASWSWVKKDGAGVALLGNPLHRGGGGGYAAHITSTGHGIALVYAQGGDCKIKLVAQPMSSPSTFVTGSRPSVILRPGITTSHGRVALRSELVHSGRHPKCRSTGLHKVETGYIRQINHVYVLAYSVGAYDKPEYKIGFAYSKNFYGPYRKVQRHVQSGSGWGDEPTEIDYVIQSEKPNWCHYETRVLGPGVPSLEHVGSRWFLYFAGAPPKYLIAKKDRFKPAKRTPFYLQVKIGKISVAALEAHPTDTQLQHWIRPVYTGGGSPTC